MNNVTVYTQVGCGFCEQMKDFLNKNQIEYKEKEISNREYYDELVELKGQSVPFTLINNKPYVGFNEKVKKAIKNFSS
ncbi:MAG: glutaredoxin family protein [Bacillota bacterium]